MYKNVKYEVSQEELVTALFEFLKRNKRLDDAIGTEFTADIELNFEQDEDDPDDVVLNGANLVLERFGV